MSKSDDLRLIEDYLPIEAISAEASREKSVRKGHISTLHLWWARRPLVACRAAVYGALVLADRWVRELDVKNPPADSVKAEAFKNGAKRGLNRKAAKEFVTKLCRYPKTKPTKPQEIKIKRETEAAIVEAHRHILEAHAERLTAELADAKETGKPPIWVEEFKFTADKVGYDDIVAGRAPRPRVLDMFAGGGAIPLEALRLGCEAFALDLNPVAHIIQLCTLVYPQRYGKSDPTVRGMTGPRNDKRETTWGGLAAEVRYWGNWVLDRVRKEIGDLYPPIPEPALWKTPPEIAFDRETGHWQVMKPGKLKRGVKLDVLNATSAAQPKMYDEEEEDTEDEVARASGSVLPGFLQPVAYLWTRTVRCKNPKCGATVPLLRQTWLCKKAGRYVALKVLTPPRTKVVAFELVDNETEAELGFDPAEFSKGGNATCPFCSTVADNEHVRAEATRVQLGHQMMAVVANGSSGPTQYRAVGDCVQPFDDNELHSRIKSLCVRGGISIPNEPIEANPRSMDVQHYGCRTWSDINNTRQLLCLISLSVNIREVTRQLETIGQDPKEAKAVATYLGVALDRLANYCTALCVWRSNRTCVLPTFSRQALPMVWDYGEMNPFAGSAGDWGESISHVCAVIESSSEARGPITTTRTSAISSPMEDEFFDAVVTDPPYYDNVTYSNLSDFFYVWLKRTIGSLYPEHFSGVATPKKNELIAASYRHGGNKRQACEFYEKMMARAFIEANRQLKSGCPMIVVYAHKTTLGWATLVDALRRAGFQVTEAWPIETEMAGGMRTDIASLASSIFLVARKRAATAGVGNYEDDVQPDLQQIVRERVDTLWEVGIAGADLVIACVGAGLRAFTKYENVEYANGEEVPAEKFLAEVEGAVLDRMMEKLFGQSGGKVSVIDPASRFYVLWRFVYKTTDIDAGEAIVFTYAQHVELDGPLGLSTGRYALVEKKKAKYRARDFTERGDNDKLGLPDDNGIPAPLIDMLHRVLWLMENSPRKLREFLMEAGPDRERLRLLAQALAGAALSGKTEEDAEKLVGTTGPEKAALGKLLANWRSVIENVVESREDRADRKAGQKRLFE